MDEKKCPQPELAKLAELCRCKYWDEQQNKIEQLQAENEVYEHVIDHVLSCKDTTLCNNCRWILNQALKG